MKRNEACLLLTKIAQSELIDKSVSKELLKIRDSYVCSPNKILDVLITEEAQSVLSMKLIDYIDEFCRSNLFSGAIKGDLNDLRWSIDRCFNMPCKEMYLETRCKNCQNYMHSCANNARNGEKDD